MQTLCSLISHICIRGRDACVKKAAFPEFIGGQEEMEW